MKKLAKILAIVTLSVFISTVFALAGDWNPWKYFHGKYSMSSSGSCVHSSKNYELDTDRGWWTAPLDSEVYVGPTVTTGTWIFNKDKSGEFTNILYAATTTPPEGMQPAVPPAPSKTGGGLRIFDVIAMPFTYDITPSGEITVYDRAFVYKGSVSLDWGHMSLVNVNDPPLIRDLPKPFGFTICTETRTLIRLYK
jgi:hypothetical protein